MYSSTVTATKVFVISYFPPLDITVVTHAKHLTQNIFLFIYSLPNSYNHRKDINQIHYILITNIQEGAYPLTHCSFARFLMNYGGRAGTKHQTSAIFLSPGGTQTPFTLVYSLIHVICTMNYYNLYSLFDSISKRQDQLL